MSAPGVQVFFFVALRRAPRPFGGAKAKKKHHPGCLFFAPASGKGREGEAPLGAGTGPEQKKNTTLGVFSFCSGTGERQGKEKPRWAPARGQSKKKNTTPGFSFFLAAAPAKGRGRRSPVDRRHGAKAKKKKHHPGCFFFCSGSGERQGKEKPRWAPARGRSKKKNTTPGFSFFLAAAPAKGRGRRNPVGRRDLSAWPEQRKRRTARAFLFVLVLLFRAWCYWFLEFCLLSSSGVQSFLLLRAIGCKLFGGAGAKKALFRVVRLLLRPLLGYTTFRHRRSPRVTGLELFFAARFGRPGVFCLSRTVGLRYFPAGPEEKQQNDKIVFESPWRFSLNALNFVASLWIPQPFGGTRAKENKTEHLFERAETCNTFLRVGGLIPWW